MGMRLALIVLLLWGCKTPAPETSAEVKDSFADVESYCQDWATREAGRGLGWRVRYQRYYQHCLDEYARQQDNSDTDRSNSVLIVAINGRSSCRIPGFPDGLYMYNPARHLAKDLESDGVSSDTLHVCLFASDLRLSVQNMRIKALYYKNGQPEVLGDALLPRNRYFIKHLPALIRKLAEGREVVMVGHSYGGWVALNTVNYSIDSSGSEIFTTKALYTIDPISPHDCDILRFLDSDPTNTRASCRQFPSDIDTGVIRSRAGVWVNFFQRQGKIASHQSRGGEDSYHFLDSEECGHRYLGANRAVWGVISRTTREFLNGGRYNEADFGRYDGDPAPGTGGECGSLTDSGEGWSDPGTVSAVW